MLTVPCGQHPAAGSQLSMAEQFERVRITGHEIKQTNKEILLDVITIFNNLGYVTVIESSMNGWTLRSHRTAVLHRLTAIVYRSVTCLTRLEHGYLLY
jgi:hypothetical protein